MAIVFIIISSGDIEQTHYRSLYVFIVYLSASFLLRVVLYFHLISCYLDLIH